MYTFQVSVLKKVFQTFINTHYTSHI